MRTSARCAAIAGVVAAAPACSLLVSTSDLSATQIPADGGAGDALRPDDGGQQDTDGSDASWCPVGALICDDFERTTPLGGWDNALLDRGGTQEIVHGTPFGRALAVAVPAGSSGYARAALQRTKREQIGDFFTYRSRLRVNALPDTGGVNLNEMYFHRADSQRASVFFALRSGAIALFEQDCSPGCSKQQSYDLGSFSIGEWHDVVVRVDFSVKPSRLTAEIDGTVVHSNESAVDLPPGAVEITAGISFTTTPHGGASVHVDRVAVEGR